MCTDVQYSGLVGSLQAELAAIESRIKSEDCRQALARLRIRRAALRKQIKRDLRIVERFAAEEECHCVTPDEGGEP